MKRYSQNNEQDFATRYFSSFSTVTDRDATPKPFVGTFLDIGANDGITLSNTHALALMGWHGLCVDGSPAAFDRLKKTYEGNDKIQCLNYLVGDKTGMRVLHESGELLGMGDTSLVSSVKQDQVKRWDSLNIPFVDVNVEMKTFGDLMKEAYEIKYHMVSLDIEGMECEVVPQIDFRSLGTRMAIIEWNGSAGNFYDELMFPQGFRLIHTNAENRIYCI